MRDHVLPTLWDFVRSLNPIEREAWVCIGDFNDLASNAEKLGRRVRSS